MNTDLICFSHLRWKFVYQRPQHLMSRFSRRGRVFFLEEPALSPGPVSLEISQETSSLWRLVPLIPPNLSRTEEIGLLKCLLDELIATHHIQDFIAWYYTPMALSFSRHLSPAVVVYDCMDELSAFQHAPQELTNLEQELLQCSNLVFTGGRSLYEAKKDRHARVYLFPSSIDFPHFAQARTMVREPADQDRIPAPRLGFFGVVDERLDLDLLAGIADLRPDWNFVIVGPVVKIDAARLPQRGNIHYLGMKSYSDLPAYLAGWDVALLPFARNASTRFISPTKTPEYLAGGKPVVSTPIADVVQPYGEKGLVWIAETAPEFIQAIQSAMARNGDHSTWLQQVDELLAQNSWDDTWDRMDRLISAELKKRPVTLTDADTVL